MKSKIVNIALYVVFVPIALFEYFILFWVWGGADVFNFILTPAAFVLVPKFARTFGPPFRQAACLL